MAPKFVELDFTMQKINERDREEKGSIENYLTGIILLLIKLFLHLAVLVYQVYLCFAVFPKIIPRIASVEPKREPIFATGTKVLRKPRAPLLSLCKENTNFIITLSKNLSLL